MKNSATCHGNERDLRNVISFICSVVLAELFCFVLLRSVVALRCLVVLYRALCRFDFVVPNTIMSVARRRKKALK